MTGSEVKTRLATRSVRKELRLTPELESRVREARGDVSFNRFVEGTLEAALATDQGSVAPRGPGVDTPAERPAPPRAPRKFSESQEAAIAKVQAPLDLPGLRPARTYVKKASAVPRPKGKG